MALPEPLRAALEGLIAQQPLHGLLAALPADLAAVAGTPEGLLAILLSLALGALCLLALAGGRRQRTGSTILLCGPAGGGKTTLFFTLVDGSTHNGVVASMRENAGTAAIPSPRGGTKAARLLDVPGHHAFRHRLEAALGEAAGVVFVVDAVDITPHRLEAADALWEVLCHPGVQRRRTPLLVACNKADLDEEAHSVDFIRKTLERQLDAMRRTKTAGIGKDAAGSAAALGPADAPFSFAGLRSRVLLAECSAQEGQLGDVTAFMAACV
ncbi:Srprb [Scenedesmus sp. PABB004]|nr:Srprb [Scenedesmus sp. PABB004]